MYFTRDERQICSLQELALGLVCFGRYLSMMTLSCSILCLLVLWSVSVAQTNAVLHMDMNEIHSCSVRLETDRGFETCVSERCSEYPNPWRVVETFVDDRACHLTYLNLSFSTYDQLLVFAELQSSTDRLLEHFFDEHHVTPTMLQVRDHRRHSLPFAAHRRVQRISSISSILLD